ncbi:MAG: hypothetical protein AAFX99_22295, partial [Myxococcota bacterium]
ESALSKLGRVAPDDGQRRTQLEELMVDDVWEQLWEQHGEHLNRVGPEEQDLLQAVLSDEVQRVVQAYLQS